MTAGTAVVNNAARFDGTEWQPMGELEAAGDVLLRLTDGSLVLGGELDGMRRWDGTRWATLGPPVDGRIGSIVEHENNLFVAGDFTQAGSATVNHVARFRDGTYEPVGNGLPSPVKVLGVNSAGQLCAGLVDASPTPLHCWNGSRWSAEPLRGRSVAAIETIERKGGKISWSPVTWRRRMEAQPLPPSMIGLDGRR